MRQFDQQRPNLARMYDYMLGGTDNFAVDRLAIEQLAELVPEAVPLARANRAFLQRAVRYVAAAGVRQFLDLGSGLPTQGSAHEVAPEARVVYVDHDPVVAAHAQALLAADAGRAVCVQADLLDADDVLAKAGAHLDLARPVGILLVSILHFLPDSARPDLAVARLRERAAPGSFLVISHATTLGRLEDEEHARGGYRGSSGGRGADRRPSEIRAFFGDLPFEPPGLVQAVDWRPDRPKLVGDWALPSSLMAGVARKIDQPPSA
ncbi:SAM-dependent methyltransferase [Actinomadura sp. ATCC 31491]|uniref:SAM-dependent methyltransferase n=1 Tax=Actinomadura luzonensis TaxID=2805427 RepID=A0ABT0FXT6_9ACTN|nr:SAM-dependent methyltransferase [Actinomadura luzonensis]MCK2217120.1 SAM-dependent methyltransferase [Actinomadura luzonensis]